MEAGLDVLERPEQAEEEGDEPDAETRPIVVVEAGHLARGDLAPHRHDDDGRQRRLGVAKQKHKPQNQERRKGALV